jgi:hypothetical protein
MEGDAETELDDVRAPAVEATPEVVEHRSDRGGPGYAHVLRGKQLFSAYVPSAKGAVFMTLIEGRSERR